MSSTNIFSTCCLQCFNKFAVEGELTNNSEWGNEFLKIIAEEKHDVNTERKFV